MLLCIAQCRVAMYVCIHAYMPIATVQYCTCTWMCIRRQSCVCTCACILQCSILESPQDLMSIFSEQTLTYLCMCMYIRTYICICTYMCKCCAVTMLFALFLYTLEGSWFLNQFLLSTYILPCAVYTTLMYTAWLYDRQIRKYASAAFKN